MTSDPRCGKKEIITVFRIANVFEIHVSMINISYGPHRYNMCSYVLVFSPNRDCILFAGSSDVSLLSSSGSDPGVEPLVCGSMYSQKALEDVAYYNIRKNLSASPKSGHAMLISDVMEFVRILFLKMDQMCSMG